MLSLEFQKLLQEKYPQATSYKTDNGMAVVYQSGGKVYEYIGTIEYIAERLNLIEVWYIEDGFGVVGKAHSMEEANKIAQQFSDAEEASDGWSNFPRIFTIRRLS